MLSERERRELEGIEHRLEVDDPAFAVAMRGTGRQHHLRPLWWKWAMTAVAGAVMACAAVCLLSIIVVYRCMPGRRRTHGPLGTQMGIGVTVVIVIIGTVIAAVISMMA